MGLITKSKDCPSGYCLTLRGYLACAITIVMLALMVEALP